MDVPNDYRCFARVANHLKLSADSAYTEWFAFIPSGADTARTEHYFNGGFSYLISNDIQFDIRAGVGLNDAADDYFLGTGFSIRFP